jgi:hypothetical protein
MFRTTHATPVARAGFHLTQQFVQRLRSAANLARDLAARRPPRFVPNLLLRQDMQSPETLRRFSCEALEIRGGTVDPCKGA